MYAPMPLPLVFLLVVYFIYQVCKPRRNSYRRNLGRDGLTPQERANVETMKKIVAQYEGYTAEVINFAVSGRKIVSYWREVPIGTPLEIRKDGILYYVYESGRRVYWFVKSEGSNIERLFDENIPFHAYLGGRNGAFLSGEDLDFSSIIIFYKIDGVPPTKVDLQAKAIDENLASYKPTKHYHAPMRQSDIMPMFNSLSRKRAKERRYFRKFDSF